MSKTNGLKIIRIILNKMKSDNKLMKTLTDAVTITGITAAAGYGWIAKQLIKEPITSNLKSNFMSYAKITVVALASLAKKQYLEDNKILLDC